MSETATRPNSNAKARGSDPANPRTEVLFAPIADQTLKATAAGIELLQTNLRMWRGVADTVRESIRHQQDAMLRSLQTQTASALEPPKDADTKPARTFLSPLFEVQRTYEQMGAAMLDAQREAMAKLSGEDRPH